MSLHQNIVAAVPFVQADLNYLVPTGKRPRSYTYDPPDGTPRTTIEPEPHRVDIHDARPLAAKVSLDEQGFGILQQRSAVTEFDDDGEIQHVYYKEAEDALKAATGADRVFIFDHTVRRRIPGAPDRAGARQPVQRVHVDHTEKSAPQRVRDFLGDEADELLRGRVQVINLWRPIRFPVFDSPLAVCDAATVAPGDLVPTDLVYRDRVGETYSVTFNPAHRWFYLPRMRTDEALLLKCYDSKTDGRARFAPHSAFADPNTPDDSPPRESIELRTFVFHSA
jgi:hypothetical protein